MIKIDRSSSIQNMKIYQKQAQDAYQKGMDSSKKDQVVISDEAKIMLEQNQPLDPVRAAKVQAIQEKIDNGTYQVDPQKVAEQVYSFWFNN